MIKPAGQFTNSLWIAIQNTYNDLICHPFLNQMADGTLNHNCFEHYLSQDVLYIKDDSVALEKLSHMADVDAERQFFKAMAKDGIAIEKELHKFFFKHFNVAKANEKSPVIKEYTDFLTYHTQESSYGVAAAALLPCFWIYYSVGLHIIPKSVENNVYQKWIDTYKGDDYGYYTRYFIEVVERLSHNASDSQKRQMQKAFVRSTNYELQFFEEAMAVGR